MRSLVPVSVLVCFSTAHLGCTPNQNPPAGDPPRIALTEQSVTFTAVEGNQNPTDQVIQIDNSGDGSFDFTVSSNAGWLFVSPNSGTVSDEPAALTIGVDIFGLTAAESPYEGQISVTADEADNSPKVISVALTIDAPSACSTLMEDVEVDTSLNEDCYAVSGTLSVRGGATLQIDPGVTLRFGPGAKLLIEETGAIRATGTVEEPVVMTGTVAAMGHWEGVEFVNATSQSSRLEHVVIEYAGGGPEDERQAGLTLTGETGSSVDLVNCELRNNQGYGFTIDAESGFRSFRSNTMKGNTLGAGLVQADDVRSLDDESVYSGNVIDRVAIELSSLTEDAIWSALDVPYEVLDVVTVLADLVVLPGVVLRFSDESGILIDGGSLSSIGLTDDPIVMTGVTDVAGSWQGLIFRGADSINNRIENTVIEYAGSEASDADQSAAVVLLPGVSAVRLTMKNCEIRSSGGHGVYISSPLSTTVNDDIKTVNVFEDIADQPVFEGD